MDKIEIRAVIINFFVFFISGFDLILFTLLSVEIEKLYFPNTDPTVSILAIYGTLSLSLLARVFGGLYFSRIADTHGRKPVVMICLIFLSITTILSAYIPSIYISFAPLYNTIGPLLFILSRIMIGFFIGGLWPTAAILGLEIISENNSNKNINNSQPYYWNEFKILKKYENFLDSKVYQYMQNFFFKKIESDFNKDTRKLISISARMQVGYFTGYFVAASLYLMTINKINFNEILYTHIHNLLFNITGCVSMTSSSFGASQVTCNIIQSVFPKYDNIGAFGSLSLLIGAFGIFTFILYRRIIPESPYWKKWKDVYTEADKHPKEIGNKKSKLEPGINKLLNDEKYRGKVIGFWLILSGLMYMYYSSVVIIPEILSRDSIIIPFGINLGNQLINVYSLVSMIIFFVTISANLLYIISNPWRDGSGFREKIIYKFYDISNRFSKIFNHMAERIFDISSTSEDKDKEISKQYKENNLDIILIKGVGYLLIIIGIINAIIFYLFVDKINIYYAWILILVFTVASTFIAEFRLGSSSINVGK